MSTEENKALARRAWEVVFNQRNLDALYEFYATDTIWHQPDQDLQGLEEVKQARQALRRLPRPQRQRRGCDSRGGQGGNPLHLSRHPPRRDRGLGPPTGRQIELEGIAIHRFEGSKVVEFWDRFDNLSLLQKLGLAPEQ